MREALIAYCRLSAESVEHVQETMRASGLGFIEAAVHLGVVTDKEATEARDWARSNLERRRAGVVETALRRHGGVQPTVIRHAGVGKASHRLVLAYDSDNAYGERIRALRTELMMLNDDREARELLRDSESEPG